MKRRQLIRYAGTTTISAIAASWASQAAAQKPNNTLTVQWLGHTCFLFAGNGKRILVNPYRSIGCTAGYSLPKMEGIDVVLISSQLLDEGAVDALPGNPKVLFQPSIYRYAGLEFQGIGIHHDREGGRRFGTNVAWRWTQAGIKILHLGGAAAPIGVEEQILMGSPDLLIVPVGGSDKAYNAEEAKQAIDSLKPKVVIPTHYLTSAADKNACSLAPLDDFLKLMNGVSVSRLSYDKIAIKPGDLPKKYPVIRILSDRNVLKPPTNPPTNPANKPPSNQS
jgi:L-ascorbate metabolism protein UlaG (beta-lactamase superfamily)